MLATDSHNLTRLRHLLKTHHDNAVHEAALFQKLLAATILRDFQSAVRLVQDHFPRHLERLSGDLLFRIGVAFYQNADIEKARHCLELAAAREGSWQHKAMLLVSRTHEATGNDRRAIAIIQELLALQPKKTFRRQAMKHLMKLEQQVNCKGC
jgi:hypothetical protein